MTTIHLGDCQNGCEICAYNCECEKCTHEDVRIPQEGVSDGPAFGFGEDLYSQAGGN